MELPVSGMEVQFRVPDGNDDLAILEAAGGPLEQALEVLPRLARLETHDGAELGGGPAWRTQWRDLTVADFETALLGLRQFLFGDKAGCIVRAAAHSCGVPMELEFSIASFLAEIKPGMPRRVEGCSERPGWFKFLGSDEDAVRFRLPVVDDQVKVLGHPDAAMLLAGRCIEAAHLTARKRGQVERAMETLSPSVSRPLAGKCRDCGESLTMTLHVPKLVMDELRISASGVHEEIHAIASTYHWDEAAILALPQSRRHAYASTIRRQAGEAL